MRADISADADRRDDRRKLWRILIGLALICAASFALAGLLAGCAPSLPIGAITDCALHPRDCN
ncbi:hypothetical protein SAMN05519104_6655 [Rhizobiales bacterium GAS188]|nr:hypothetical protein SAMN05519104_6655 [Rhizobiales bacterium GAS188]